MNPAFVFSAQASAHRRPGASSVQTSVLPGPSCLPAGKGGGYVKAGAFSPSAMSSSIRCGSSASSSLAIRSTSAGLFLFSSSERARPPTLSGASAFNSNCGDDGSKDVFFIEITSQVFPFVRHDEADIFILRFALLQLQAVAGLTPVKIPVGRRRQIRIPGASAPAVLRRVDERQFRLFRW